ncbi:hypothetical protein H8D30_01590 [bacterium]|nr:hypothetical protein [bacterium]
MFESLRRRFGLPSGYKNSFCSAVRGFQRNPIPTPEEIKHSERLEFLGDSCLQFAITKLLHREFPSEDEGVLSSVKGNVVSGRTLATHAEALGFHKVARGATPSRLKSFLPDVFEAFLGSLFLYKGIDAVCNVIEELFSEHVIDMVVRRSFKPLKSMLQEIAARELGRDPRYRFERVKGSAKFRAHILLLGKKVAQGTGLSKKGAEDTALEHLFPRLNEVFRSLGKLPGGGRKRVVRTKGQPTTRRIEAKKPVVVKKKPVVVKKKPVEIKKNPVASKKKAIVVGKEAKEKEKPTEVKKEETMEERRARFLAERKKATAQKIRNAQQGRNRENEEKSSSSSDSKKSDSPKPRDKKKEKGASSPDAKKSEAAKPKEKKPTDSGWTTFGN